MEIVIPSEANRGRLISFPIFWLLVYIVCTFFPVIYMYLPFLGKIRIVLLAGIALLISYMVGFANYKGAGVYRNRILYAWFGFFAVMVMSLLVSFDRGLTLQIIQANFKYLIVFMVMVKIIDSDKRLDLVITVFAACGVGMAVVTNVNYLVLGRSFAESFRAMAIEAGIFGDPNDLAMLFNATLPFLFYFLMTKRKKLLLLFGIANVIMAVMFTYSRGGFLGLCTVGFGSLLVVGKTKKQYIFLVLIGAILFWTLSPDTYRERLSTIKEEAQIDEETGKYPGRLENWRMAISEGVNRPILGAGAGCSYYIFGTLMRDWHSIHNSFIQVFLEMGFLGLLFFVPLFIVPYKQYRDFSRHNIRGLEAHLQRYRFILLSLAAFATSALFLPQAYSPILYTLSGIALIQSQLISKPTVALKIEESNVIVNPSSGIKT